MGAYEGKIGAFMGERWRPFATWKLIPEYIKHLRKFINAMEKKSITKPDKEIDSKPSFTEEESNHNKCFRT
ncbi:hypothetical protein Golob_009627, partial [Gossypium lobatum]|nr:hypothetical protein [Gossypium lobatum]